MIVLLSDGKNTSGNVSPLDVARQARALKIPIYAIALGTPSGKIELTDPFSGSTQTIAVPDLETLKEIAQLTGGRFFATAKAAELESIYSNLGTRLSSKQEKREVTVAFAGRRASCCCCSAAGSASPGSGACRSAALSVVCRPCCGFVPEPAHGCIEEGAGCGRVSALSMRSRALGAQLFGPCRTATDADQTCLTSQDLARAASSAAAARQHGVMTARQLAGR